MERCECSLCLADARLFGVRFPGKIKRCNVDVKDSEAHPEIGKRVTESQVLSLALEKGEAGQPSGRTVFLKPRCVCCESVLS